MMLRLVREPSADGATLGVLFVNGRFECFVLEDTVREQAGQPVSTWKIAGRSAIPAGRYEVVVTMSARFGRRLPLLVDVPGFAGIRIHPGNTSEDTEGCLLPGRLRAAARVGESRVAFDNLFRQLEAALGRGERCWLSIESAREALAA
jgi:hypothetical protein